MGLIITSLIGVIIYLIPYENYINKYEKWYDKRQSVLPESINKITISDIRYMVNECVNRLTYARR